MNSVEISAKNYEEAVSKGIEQLGVSIADVEIEVLEEGSKGLFGLLGNKPTVVRLTVKEDQKEEDILSSVNLKNAMEEKKKTEKTAKKAEPEATEAPAPTQKPAKKPAKAPKSENPEKAEKPAETAEPAAEPAAEVKAELPEASKPEDFEEGSPEAKTYEFLSQLTRLMGVNVSITIHKDEEGNIRADMFGDTLGVLIGRRGETLDSVQYLTSLFLNHGRDEYVRVTLDTENYRAKREEALRRLANRMANRVVKTGRKVVMEPMNPYERRILHSALQANENVTTHSEGEEPNRHVVITLKQE